MDNSRNLPIEKRIRYVIAEVEIKYRESILITALHLMEIKWQNRIVIYI